MALPTSGSLSIKDTAGTTRSIAREVDGGVSGNKSLTSLSLNSIPSKTPPHSMLEFYGYEHVPADYIELSTGISTVSTDEATYYNAYAPVEVLGQSSGKLLSINLQYNVEVRDIGASVSLYWSKGTSSSPSTWYLYDTWLFPDTPSGTFTPPTTFTTSDQLWLKVECSKPSGPNINVVGATYGVSTVDPGNYVPTEGETVGVHICCFTAYLP